jgi:hypothetical protein
VREIYIQEVMMKSVWWLALGVALSVAAACGEDAQKKNPNKKGEDTESVSSDSSKPSDNNTDEDACFEGYDSANPTLRLRAFIPTAPQPLADIGSGTQSAVDSGTVNYLLTMSGISGDGQVEGALGPGEAADGENHYRFAGDPETLTFNISGNDFTAEGNASVDLTIPLFTGDPLVLTMHEATVEGSFKDSDRCEVGTMTAEGPPSEWETDGTLGGKLLVEDTKTSTVSLTVPIQMTFSLCAYFAYGMQDALKLRDDPNCEADQSEWTYPPDTTTSDGSPAWHISADFAATAIRLD